VKAPGPLRAPYRRATPVDPVLALLKAERKVSRLQAALGDAWGVIIALREELRAERAKAARTS
jgi:hypothetical protein